MNIFRMKVKLVDWDSFPKKLMTRYGKEKKRKKCGKGGEEGGEGGGARGMKWEGWIGTILSDKTQYLIREGGGGKKRTDEMGKETGLHSDKASLKSTAHTWSNIVQACSHFLASKTKHNLLILTSVTLSCKHKTMGLVIPITITVKYLGSAHYHVSAHPPLLD